jgi:hypothetical protein
MSGEHVHAARDLVYLPTSRLVAVRLDFIPDGAARAWWYDPRGSQASEIDLYPASGAHTFTPPR